MGKGPSPNLVRVWPVVQSAAVIACLSVTWGTLVLLKVESAILIQYSFRRIQQISPHSHLAVSSMCALQKLTVSVHSPGSVNGKPSRTLFQPINQHLEEHARVVVIWLAAELKSQQPFARTADLKCLGRWVHNKTQTRTHEACWEWDHL